MVQGSPSFSFFFLSSARGVAPLAIFLIAGTVAIRLEGKNLPVRTEFGEKSFYGGEGTGGGVRAVKTEEREIGTPPSAPPGFGTPRVCLFSPPSAFFYVVSHPTIS